MTRAFTLVEVLAVIAIISLVAAAGTIGLVASTDQARLHALVSSCKDMDGHARLLAQTGKPLFMAVDVDRKVVVLRPVHDEEICSTCELPSQWSIAMRVNDRPV